MKNKSMAIKVLAFYAVGLVAILGVVTVFSGAELDINDLYRAAMWMFPPAIIMFAVLWKRG